MNTPEGGKKTKQTMIDKLGGEQAYKDFMSKLGSKSKVTKENTTFYKNRNLAKIASKVRWAKEQLNAKEKKQNRI